MFWEGLRRHVFVTPVVGLTLRIGWTTPLEPKPVNCQSCTNQAASTKNNSQSVKQLRTALVCRQTHVKPAKASNSAQISACTEQIKLSWAGAWLSLARPTVSSKSRLSRILKFLAPHVIPKQAPVSMAELLPSCKATAGPLMRCATPAMIVPGEVSSSSQQKRSCLALEPTVGTFPEPSKNFMQDQPLTLRLQIQLTDLQCFLCASCFGRLEFGVQTLGWEFEQYVARLPKS